jgi:hypothetical protein
MQPSDIKCRCCGEHYNLEIGCDICIPAKTNIIWPEVYLPILESILEQNIRINQECANDVETEIKERRRNKRTGADIRLINAAQKLSNANTGLVSEARKLRKEAAADVASLSRGQKIELLMGFVDALPEGEDKLQTLQRLTDRLKATEAKLLTE